MRIWCNGCTSPFQGEGVVRFNIPAQCNSVRKSYFASLVQLVGHYFWVIRVIGSSPILSFFILFLIFVNGESLSVLVQLALQLLRNLFRTRFAEDVVLLVRVSLQVVELAVVYSLILRFEVAD